ncbi:uncharacterized protein LOC111891437 [Lactuca sativa]|uniref:uncharacterized protein LOC111891437 n=1 Tax=Lactuca sativa TaxID=4236 RepID=UPI000CD82863|nr:uncharacterized protein LOC111891437 [Lactuca sativa]
MFWLWSGGHMSKDWPRKALICFHCNHTSHKTVDCLRLSGGAVVVTAPATLRITDGRQGKTETPVVKSRADEAQAAPNVVTGTFLVNGLSDLVLFDSGATRSFVSLALNSKFRDAPGTLDSPLEVEIVDNCTVNAARVFRRSILNMFDEIFHLDLVPIPLRGLKVIIGMDWLGPNGAMTDCERHLVRFRTPNGGELVIPGKRDSCGPALCSAPRARRLLQQGCSDDFVLCFTFEGGDHDRAE